MGNGGRIGHNRKRQPQHTLEEKRAAKQEQRQEQRASSKRGRRDAAAPRSHPTGG